MSYVSCLTSHENVNKIKKDSSEFFHIAMKYNRINFCFPTVNSCGAKSVFLSKKNPCDVKERAILVINRPKMNRVRPQVGHVYRFVFV